MATKQDVLRVASSLGGSVEDTGFDLNLDSPLGSRWVANGCTNYCVPYRTGRTTWKAEAWNDLAEVLEMGLEEDDDDSRN